MHDRSTTCVCIIVISSFLSTPLLHLTMSVNSLLPRSSRSNCVSLWMDLPAQSTRVTDRVSDSPAPRRRSFVKPDLGHIAHFEYADVTDIAFIFNMEPYEEGQFRFNHFKMHASSMSKPIYVYIFKNKKLFFYVCKIMRNKMMVIAPVGGYQKVKKKINVHIQVS